MPTLLLCQQGPHLLSIGAGLVELALQILQTILLQIEPQVPSPMIFMSNHLV
jgi:hypothetical protein